MTQRIAAIFGLIAPLVCIAALVVGALLRPDYNSVSQTISLLAAPDTPHVAAVNTLFFLYNALLIAFGVGCWILVRKNSFREKATGMLIAATGLLGIAASIFPQDPIDTPMSQTGLTHKTLSICMTLSALLAVASQSRFEKERGKSSRSRFSILMTAFLVSSGIASTIAIEVDWWAGGLVERVTLAGFLLWLEVEGLFVWNSTT